MMFLSYMVNTLLEQNIPSFDQFLVTIRSKLLIRIISFDAIYFVMY